MTHRIPADAFDYYVGLGSQRSYGAVARHFQVTKRGITKLARREHWQDRLLEIERKAAARAESEAVESLATVNRRHLRILKTLQAKALRTLQQQPITNTHEAIRALLGALAQEREIIGTPGSTGQVVIQVVTGVPRGDDPPPTFDTDAHVQEPRAVPWLLRDRDGDGA